MKKEEIVMGLVVGTLCIGVSSLVAQSQLGPSSLYQHSYSTQPDSSSEPLIEDLSDGNYRFCSDPSPSHGSESGMCFRFQKTGDRVVGNYQPADSQQVSLCIAGRVNRNTINGEAIDFSSPTAEPLQLRPELQGGNLVNWNAASTTDYLKVASGQALEPSKSNSSASGSAFSGDSALPTGSIRFRQAALDLSNFNQYSLGTIEPPTHCGAD